MAAELDRQILKNYRLHATNYAAHELVAREKEYELSKNLIIKDLDKVRDEFLKHIQKCPPESRDILIAMYSNPVVSKKW